MVTERVMAEGRDHFNCTVLEGVELENQGGLGTAFSHWEKRILGVSCGGPGVSASREMHDSIISISCSE